MADFGIMRSLAQSGQNKIVLLVMDGLGGMPVEPGGPTELEAAFRPNMNRLTAEGYLGQMTPIGYGITPGSGPGHLALFGYDPLKFDIGRVVLIAIVLSSIGLMYAVVGSTTGAERFIET